MPLLLAGCFCSHGVSSCTREPSALGLENSSGRKLGVPNPSPWAAQFMEKELWFSVSNRNINISPESFYIFHTSHFLLHLKNCQETEHGLSVS